VLVDAANRAGGEDNTSVVVIDVLEVDAATAPDPEQLAAPAAPRRPMPPAPDPIPASAPPPRAPRAHRVRGALLLFLPLILVLGTATAGVAWYARRSYYVGFANHHVVIYKGVPGGVLGWNPTVDEATKLEDAQLTQIDHDRVAGGAARGSLSGARAFVTTLESDVAATSTTTTSTTAAPPTTKPRSTKPKRTTTTPVTKKASHPAVSTAR
jgi:protein phosphatase